MPAVAPKDGRFPFRKAIGDDALAAAIAKASLLGKRRIVPPACYYDAPHRHVKRDVTSRLFRSTIHQIPSFVSFVLFVVNGLSVVCFRPQN